MTTTLRSPGLAAGAARTVALLSPALYTHLAPPPARAGFIGDVPTVFGPAGMVSGQTARLP